MEQGDSIKFRRKCGKTSTEIFQKSGNKRKTMLADASKVFE